MLKRFLLIWILLFTFSNVLQAQDDEEIENTSVFEQNKQYPRVHVVPYDDSRDITTFKYHNSSSYLDLNGSWHFRLQQGTELLKSDMKIDTIRFSEWGKIVVPGNWVIDGKKIEAPRLKNKYNIVSSKNHIGTYYKDLNIPIEWKGQTLYLYIGAAKSAYAVWINGQYVGYSEDSKTPSEFDITDYIKWGKSNHVIIQVSSISNGSLLEAKAPTQFNGIERDVFIYAKPIANIVDFSIATDYQTKTNNGIAKLIFIVQNKERKGDYYIEVEILDAKGKEVDRFGKWVTFSKRSEVEFETERIVSGVQPWSAESPNLYTLVIRLKNKKMETLDMVGTRFGFRNIDFSKGILMLNGNPITIKGVVRGEYTTDFHRLTQESMRREVQLMKAHNINAVRVAFAPQHPYFYELCDEYGIYVFDEANIQPNNIDKIVSTNKEYSNIFVGRVRNMYERDKNHPSIIAWSLGDGTDNGVCFEDAYRYLRMKDEKRPIVYNGTESGTNTDFIYSKYKSTSDLLQFANRKQTRAMIMSEYGSTQGNSFGSTQKLWDIIRNNAMLQGGFIAYWNDMEFFDTEQDKNVRVSGLIDEKGNPKPYLSEVKELYKNVDIELLDITKGRFRVTNHFDFANLKEYVLEYSLFSNLKSQVVGGEVPVDIPPGASREFELRIPSLKAYAGEEYYIRFTLKQRKDSPIFKRGTEFTFAEFPLPMPTLRKQELRPYEKQELYLKDNTDAPEPIEVNELNMKNTESSIQVFNEDVEFVFDLKKGEIVSLKCMDQDVFTAPPRLNFWRAATDNDKIDKSRLKQWNLVGLEKLTRKLSGVTYKQNDKYTVSIDVIMSYENEKGINLFDIMQTIVVYCTGDVIIENQVLVSDVVQSLPRVGMQFEIPKSFGQTEWFGLNNETYRDRKRSGKVGTYQKPTPEMSFLYTNPQENGNHTDTRWVSFENDQVGVFFDAVDKTFDFSVSPYTTAQLYNASSTNDLKPNRFWTVNIDQLQAGIGNGEVLYMEDEQMLKDKKYVFKVHFRAYEKSNHAPFDFRMIALPNMESNILPMPTIVKDHKRFDTPMTITLAHANDGVEIHYTLDGTDPTEKSMLYMKPFVIDKTTLVKAKAFRKGSTPSFTVQEQFNYNFIESVTYENAPSPPYNRNMETILFDGEYGNTADLENGWLGFSGTDFSAILKLVRPINLQSVVMAFAHVPDAWAFAPKNISIYVSSDGENYSKAYTPNFTFDAIDEGQNVSQLVYMQVPVPLEKVKFIKIEAKSIGKIPSWHQAKGLRPWIMIDEIQINERIQ